MRIDLLDAVRAILKDKGFIHLDINTICEYADVDRNAIYRHFNSFDNLLTKFIESKEYLRESFEIGNIDNIDDHKEFLKDVLLKQYESANKNSELQQIFVWELAELSLRTKLIAERREEVYGEFVKKYESEFKDSDVDINTSIAIILAGIYYLTIHKKHSTFCRVDFKKEKARVTKTIEHLIDMLFEAKEKEQQKLDYASKALQNGIDAKTVCKIFDLEPELVESI
jgi:AcrR family transcriptional regulator